jgi:hypothetical protein
MNDIQTIENRIRILEEELLRIKEMIRYLKKTYLSPPSVPKKDISEDIPGSDNDDWYWLHGQGD